MTIELTEHNPLLKRPLLELLALVEQNSQMQRNEIENLAEGYQEKGTIPQTPTTFINILLRNDALKEHIYVDGKIYEGSLQDIQTEVSIEEDVKVEQYLSITDFGKEILDEYSGDKKLRELLAEKPQYTDVYIKMLESCATAQGCDRINLEKAIGSMPQLAPDAVGVQTIYPQYFIDSLETAGGISWHGSWHTTETGRAVMHGEQ